MAGFLNTVNRVVGSFGLITQRQYNKTILKKNYNEFRSPGLDKEKLKKNLNADSEELRKETAPLPDSLKLVCDHIDNSEILIAKPGNGDYESFQKLELKKFVQSSGQLAEGTDVIHMSPNNGIKKGPDDIVTVKNILVDNKKIILEKAYNVGVEYKFRQQPFRDRDHFIGYIENDLWPYSENRIIILALNNPEDMILATEVFKEPEYKKLGWADKIILQNGADQVGINLPLDYKHKLITPDHPQYQMHIDYYKHVENNSPKDLELANIAKAREFISNGGHLVDTENPVSKHIFSTLKEKNSLLGGPESISKLPDIHKSKFPPEL